MSKGNPLLELASQLNDGDFNTGPPPKAKATKRKRSTAKSRAAAQDIAPPPFNAVVTPGSSVCAQNPFDDYPSQYRYGMPNRRPGPGMPGMHGMPGMPPNMGGPGVPSMPMVPGPGKMYPPNQSTIFNSTNPNAPPIYPCGICHKEVHDNDQAILCESGCNFWFHRICTGLTDAAYHMLTQEVYAEWVCDKCVATKNIPLVKLKP